MIKALRVNFFIVILSLSLGTGVFFSCSTKSNNQVEMVKADTVSNFEKLTTLILVRHAEKIEDGSENPPLSEQGKNRALHLATMLKNAGITAIYSTPFQRNINTAKPLADSLKLKVKTYDQKQDLVIFLEKVKEDNHGGKVLICGHSTTIPDMLNVLLKEKAYYEPPKDAYNDVYVVSLVEDKTPVIINLNVEM